MPSMVFTIWTWISALFSRPRVSRRGKRALVRNLLLGIAAIIAIAVAMLVLDPTSVARARALPESVRTAFAIVTEFGESGKLLWPVGILLILCAALADPRRGKIPSLVVTAVAVRLGFVFCAVGFSRLVVSVLKFLIGRGRPVNFDEYGAFIFRPFGWNVDFYSLPSGHAANGFSIAVALGLLFPAWRPFLLVYAVLIAISRPIVAAHYPSDVIAGAVVGIIGAILVRDWFALRRLGFVVRADGSVKTLPGPSFRRAIGAFKRPAI